MSSTRQTTFGDDYGTLEFEIGDLIERRESGRTTKLALTECPLCAADPSRPRHHFEEQESRAAHIADAHGE